MLWLILSGAVALQVPLISTTPTFRFVVVETLLVHLSSARVSEPDILLVKEVSVI